MDDITVVRYKDVEECQNCSKGDCMHNKPDAIDGNFANFMMVIVAAPVVLAWVGLSIYLVAMAFSNPDVVVDIESYKSVLLIIGSPALVIIYKVLELWTAQQNSQIEQVRKGTFKNGTQQVEEEECKPTKTVKKTKK